VTLPRSTPPFLRVRFSAFLIPSALLLALPLATEASILSFGGKVPLSLSVTSTARYDSNVFLDAAEQGDASFIVSPTVTYEAKGSVFAANASLSGQVIRFLDNTDLNTELADLSADFAYDTSRTILRSSVFYRETDQTDVRATSFELSQRQTQWGGGVTAAWEGTGKLSGNTGLSYTVARFESLLGLDNEGWNVPLGVSYTLTPKVRANFSANHGRTRVPDLDRRNRTTSTRLGFSGDFTPKLTGSVGAGWDWGEQAGASAGDGFGFDLSLSYAYSQLTSVSVRGSRQLRTNLGGNVEHQTTLGTSLRLDLDEFWGASLGLSASRSDGALRGGEETYVNADATVNRILTLTTTLSASVTVRQSWGASELQDYRSVLVSVFAAMRL
jgi:hypothetical protein